MSVKKTSALVTFIWALSLALFLLFVESHHDAAVAQAPAPKAQSSEGFGLMGGCQVGNALIPLESACGLKTDITLCSYSQENCKGDAHGVGACTPGRHDEPVGTVCQAGSWCTLPSKCGSGGNCIPGTTVDCSSQNTECKTYGCAPSPGGTCMVTKEQPAIDVVCTKTEDPNVCGQKYWVRHSVSTPGKCGGKTECQADYQQDGPPCPRCNCTYYAPVAIRSGMFFCQTLCGTILGPSSDAAYDSAGGCTCGQVPISLCPPSVNIGYGGVENWPLVQTKPEECRPNTEGKTPTACSWAALGTQTYGITLAQGAAPTALGGVPGTFSYSYGLNDLLPMGDSTLTATFTPSDTTLYTGSTCTSTVSIQPKKSACTVTGGTGTYGTSSSSLVNANAYDAQFSFIPVKGSFAYTINGQPLTSSLILDAGKTYTVVATFTPSDFGYSGTSCSGSITIDAQTAICTVDSASRSYNTVLSRALGFVCRVGSSVITSGITGGSVAAPPAQSAPPGDYPVGFSTDPTSTNYTIQVLPGTVSVTPVDSSCQVPSQSVQSVTPVSFGGVGYIAGTTTPLGGNFVYKQGTTIVTDGSMFPVGTYTITADFTPSNAGYKSSPCSGTITVTEKPQQGTYCTVSASAVSYGTGVTFTSGAYDSSTRTAVAGTFSYTVDAKAVTSGAVLAAKTGYALTATFTPSVGGYSGSTCSGVFTVSPKLINVQVNSATVQYGQDIRIFTKADFTVDPLVAPDTKDSLFGVTVPTTTAIKGNAANTTYPITVATPTSTNYTFKVTNGTLTIQKVKTSCELTGATTIMSGTAASFGAKAYAGTTLLSGGSFVYKAKKTSDTTWTIVSDNSALTVGTYQIQADYTPGGTDNYDPSVCTMSLTVTDLTPTRCDWPEATAMILGSSLSSKLFDTTEPEGPKGYVNNSYTVDNGTYGSFSHAAGAVLPIGTTTVKGKFTPKAAGYAASDCATKVTVNPKEVTVQMGNASVGHGQDIPIFTKDNFTATGLVLPDTKDGIFGATVPTTTAKKGDPLGLYPITITAPTNSNYTWKKLDGTLTIKQALSSCALTNLTGQTVTSGTSVLFGARGYAGGTSTIIKGTWDFKEGATSVVSGSTTFAIGTHTISATFTPSNPGYKSSTCSGTFIVRAPDPIYTICNVYVSSITYGTPLPLRAEALDLSGNVVDGTFAYAINGQAVNPGDILNASNWYAVTATFTPSSSVYAGTSCYSGFAVARPTALCTAGSATRDYNTTLASPLGFECRLGGTLVQSGISGGALSAPPAQDALPQTYPITFKSAPTATNYIIGTENGSVTVNQVATRCELAGLTGQTVAYGTFVDTTPTGYIGQTATTLPGSTFFRIGSTDLPSGNNGILKAGTVLPVGLNTISARFQPTNAGGYGISNCDGSVTVAGCTTNAQCTVDDGNACTSNACCTAGGGCAVGSTLIPGGHCYNKPITGPVGGITPSLELICPAEGSKYGSLKFTWADNGTCIDPQSSAYSFLLVASTMSLPVFTPTPGPSDVLSTTVTRGACSAGTCTVTRQVPAGLLRSGTTISGGVAIGTSGNWNSSNGTTSKTSTCKWCGDVIINGAEQCDGPRFPANKTAAMGYRCNACTLEWCGDLKKNGTEDCDGNAPGQPQCTSTCTITGKATSCTVSPTTVTFGSGAVFNGVGKIGGTSTNLAGSFVYTLTAGGSSITAKDGDILDAKTYAVSAKFLPTDPTYAGSTCTGSLTVNPAAATCTGENKERPYNTANPSIGYTCLSGGVNKNGQLSGGTFKSTDFPALTAPASTTAYPITFDVKPSSTNYSVTYTNGSIKVTKATAACTIGSPTITAGSPITHAMFNPTMVPSGTMSYFNTTLNTALVDGSTPPAGTYSIKGTLAPTDSTNYLSSDCTGVLTVKKPVTCSTVPVRLPTSKTFNQTFVTSGFTVTADVILGGSWTFTVGGAPINYAQRPTALTTVVGTFQPTNSGYSSVTCSTTVTPVQCTSSTFAQDCTADDGNACTDNACTAQGQCFNKYKGIAGTLSPQVTLTCPNTFTMTFNNVLKCVNPALSPQYHLGVDSIASVVFNSNTGNVVDGNTNVVSCTGSTCTYTAALPTSLFYTGKTLYGGVAAFESSTIKQQANQSALGTCTAPSGGGGGGTNQCPPSGSSCGSSCTRAPYPDCGWTCAGTCPTNAITYYTAEGECLIATAWGPSASCCPNQGCDIKPHGYGDQYDGEWFKMVPLSSACPSEPATIVGDDIRCPTCHCGNDTDCRKKAADGTLIDFKFVPSLPKYGHLEGETVDDDRCFCHPNQDACPSGYVPLQQPFTVHYTDIATKGLLAGTTCQ